MRGLEKHVAVHHRRAGPGWLVESLDGPLVHPEAGASPGPWVQAEQQTLSQSHARTV